MSTALPAQISLSARSVPASRRAHEAIARAAERTGADFTYLLAQARLESSLDPNARARTSSAAGLFQFIDSTWLETLDRHGSSHGLPGISEAIGREGGRARVTDPALRGAIMDLRFDPAASALMAGALAEDNRIALTRVLGREPDAAELYLAHFLGAAGATRFLTAHAADPTASAAQLLPAQAAANRSIFYGPGGGARSLGEVIDVIRTKMAGAMGAQGVAPSRTGLDNFAAAQTGWQAVAGRAGASHMASPPDAPGRPNSMAETLRASFALADPDGSSPAGTHVRNAYGKLKALGL